MVRQARSETTRRKIITSAVELFNEIGYPAAGLGDIIERAAMTKGALYYHFDSKEALATAIIDEGATTALTAFRNIGEPSAPALENMIHGGRWMKWLPGRSVRQRSSCAPSESPNVQVSMSFTGPTT